MSAKSEAERYFNRRNDYWKFEESRKKPAIKSPIREMKDAAAAECRCIGIHGAKDYSCKTLARIILKEEPETEDEATNLLCSWHVGKIVYDDEYAERKARTTERTKGERGRAAKPQNQRISLPIKINAIAGIYYALGLYLMVIVTRLCILNIKNVQT